VTLKSVNRCTLGGVGTFTKVAKVALWFAGLSGGLGTYFPLRRTQILGENMLTFEHKGNL
jgi:hypothetical protein